MRVGSVCLSVRLSDSPTFCLSVCRLVGRYVRVHAYVRSCVYTFRQADRQTDRLHASTERKKENKLFAIF